MSHRHNQHSYRTAGHANRRTHCQHGRCCSSHFRLLETLVLSVVSFFVLSASSVHADVRYVYDEAGRLVQVIGPTGESARYNYDAAGNLTSITRFAVGDLAISEFTPDRGPIGTIVTISGVGFSTTVSSNIVKFNGVVAVVSAATATTLTTKVPTGATTGPISVTVGTKVATSAIPFTVTTGPVNGIPVITAFTPIIGAVGAVVTITGNNYDTTPANNFVHFNATQATVASSTLTTINTTVPTGTTSGPIKVRTAAGTALSSKDFFVVPTGQTAANISVTQRIAVDGTPLAINTGTAGKVAMVLFNGTQGQYLGLGVTPVTVTGGSATLFIKTPSGADLILQRSFSSTFSLDFPRLPETGSYTLLIVPSATAVVTATLTLSTDVVKDLGTNVTTSVSTSTRVGQNARYSFAGTAGQYLGLGLTNLATTPAGQYVYLYVYKPDGSELKSCSYTYSGMSCDLPVLPVNGTYTIFVDNGEWTSTFNLLLSNCQGITYSKTNVGRWCHSILRGTDLSLT